MDAIPHEEYRLTFEHELVYPDGTTVRMGAPVTVKQCVLANTQHEPYKSLLIEEMMKRMKHFVLEEEGTYYASGE